MQNGDNVLPRISLAGRCHILITLESHGILDQTLHS